jgi:hypothetical protein
MSLLWDHEPYCFFGTDDDSADSLVKLLVVVLVAIVGQGSKRVLKLLYLFVNKNG